MELLAREKEALAGRREEVTREQVCWWWWWCWWRCWCWWWWWCLWFRTTGKKERLSLRSTSPHPPPHWTPGFPFCFLIWTCYLFKWLNLKFNLPYSRKKHLSLSIRPFKFGRSWIWAKGKEFMTWGEEKQQIMTIWKHYDHNHDFGQKAKLLLL